MYLLVSLWHIAGYLGTKTVKEFGCESIWRQTTEEAEDAGPEFTFFNNKQCDGLQTGGLFRPSYLLLNFLYALEIVFREHVTQAVHNPNIRLRYVESIKKEQDIFLVVCGDTDCHKSHMYMVNLYFTVRIHHLLKEQSRSLHMPGVKRNRKVIKLLHV